MEHQIERAAALELRAGPPSGKAVSSMNPKGPSHVDRLSAGAPPSAGTSRRGLLGAAGLAGLAGAATVLASSTASAAPEEQPSLPTEADTALITEAMRLEMTARDLYRRRLSDDVGAGDITDIVQVLADNHRAYAEAIAGRTGVSADRRNDEVYDSLVADFEGGRERFLTAAHSLEQTAVATHTALLGQYQGLQVVQLTASILVVEARHATVLADLLGVDLDTKLGNDAEPLDLGGVA